MQNGSEEELELKDIAIGEALDLSYKLRSFKRFETRLVLPEGFTADRVASMGRAVPVREMIRSGRGLDIGEVTARAPAGLGVGRGQHSEPQQQKNRGTLCRRTKQTGHSYLRKRNSMCRTVHCGGRAAELYTVRLPDSTD